jgi:hypothetical protein
MICSEHPIAVATAVFSAKEIGGDGREKREVSAKVKADDRGRQAHQMFLPTEDRGEHHHYKLR